MNAHTSIAEKTAHVAEIRSAAVAGLADTRECSELGANDMGK
jgi:hypothetical protein